MSLYWPKSIENSSHNYVDMKSKRKYNLLPTCGITIQNYIEYSKFQTYYIVGFFF